MKKVCFYEDPNYNFEIIRTMSHAVNGAADINECMNLAERVNAGDGEAFYREFYEMAGRIYAFGKECEAKGHKLSAYNSYLRASNYYRMSDFYLHADASDPRILDASRKAVGAFKESIPGFAHPIECVEIPYEGTMLPAYFIKSSKAADKAPVVIILNGFDGTKEESIYGMNGIMAADHGYHVLAVEGPGQGEAVKEQKLYFRPDYEVFVTACVDYLFTRDEVDTGRIALHGVSLGGLLVGSAAVHEQRIKAVVANSGLVSDQIWVDLSLDGTGYLAYEDPEKFNEISARLAKKSTGLQWYFDNGKMVFGAKDNAELVRKYLAMSYTDADKITATTLVLDSDAEHFFPGCAQAMYDQLTCPKTMMVMTRAEGVQYHCQVGGELYGGHLIFNWLDEVMGIQA